MRRQVKTTREATPAGTGMQKVVTDKASFVLYVPKGWKAQEAAVGQAIQVTASDPSGRSSVLFSTGAAPQGENAATLAKHEAAKLGRAARDLEIQSAFASRDGSSLVFDGSYSTAKRGKIEFRSWVSLQGGQSSCARIEAPAGQLAAMKPTLLTVLSNIRVMKGAVAPAAAAAPVQVQMVPYRLRDGSASFMMPQGWQCQDHGKGTLRCRQPGRLLVYLGQRRSSHPADEGQSARHPRLAVPRPQPGLAVYHGPLRPRFGHALREGDPAGRHGKADGAGLYGGARQCRGVRLRLHEQGGAALQGDTPTGSPSARVSGPTGVSAT